MTTRINVHVTDKGVDTKYLFPGSHVHSVGGTQQISDTGSLWYYSHNATYKGEAAYLQYLAYGSWISTNNGTDLGGAALAWQLFIPAKDNIQIGYVSVTDAGNNNVAIAVPSLASATPDTAITDALKYGDAQMWLYGNTGNDTLRGSYWHDVLDGGKGSDVMIGGGGNDHYAVERSGDKVVEKRDGGNDTIVTTVNLTLPKHVERLYAGGDRDVRLTGNGLDNVFSGNNGNDTIKGLDGHDTIMGRDGKDVLEGGSGRDHFLFYAAPGRGNADVVKDFRHKYDMIELAEQAYFGLNAGVPSATQIPANLFHASKSGKAHDADDRILYDKDDGRLYFDPDGNGSTERGLIATFTDHPKITAADILII